MENMKQEDKGAPNNQQGGEQRYVDQEKENKEEEKEGRTKGWQS